MIIASIDIGSNTIILLIAQFNKSTQELIPIINEYRVPRISQGLAIDRMIQETSITRLITGLDEFYKIIYEHKADLILVNATNAFRIANNGFQIKQLIEERYSWKVNIITGEREAELTFLGIALPSFPINENIILIDIGGGSTEVSYGSISKTYFSKSFLLGIVSLFERYVTSDPPTEDSLTKIREEIKNILSQIKNHIPENQNAIAVAGTPTTLASIMLHTESFEDSLVEKSELQKDYLNKFILEITPLNSSEIKFKYGDLVEGRENLILIGTIILEELMNILSLKKIKVSTKGLRYGAVWDYLIATQQYSITVIGGDQPTE